MKLGSLGAGHMGSAILRAALDTGLYKPEAVYVSSPIPAELESFSLAGCHVSRSNRDTVQGADLILLAVRPAQAETVLKEIAGLADGKCVISICAGVTVSRIKSLLPPTAHVLRVMPNLPLAYGLGATVMANPCGVPEEFTAAAKALFECGGTVEVLDEKLINAATALGGSAVAYFFRMAGVMSDWAEENGITASAALRIVSQTMAGGAKMLTLSEKDPFDLAGSVAVPGGTTEAAFRAFDSKGLDEALKAGMDACRNRGIELLGI
jgi:pyrroline-5-carboxylate reductase